MKTQRKDIDLALLRHCFSLLLCLCFSWYVHTQEGQYNSLLQKTFLTNHLQLDSLLSETESNKALSISDFTQFRYFQFRYRNALNKSDTTMLYLLRQNKTLSELAELHYYECKLISGVLLSEASLWALKNDTSFLERRHYCLGIHYFLTGNNQLAQTFFESVLAGNDLMLKASAMMRLGHLYVAEQKWQKAYEQYLATLDWVSSEGFSYYEAKVNNHLGNVLIDLERYDLAFQAYTQTRLIASQIGATRLLSLAIANIAFLKLKENAPYEAVSLFQQALIYLYKIKDIQTVARVQQRLGQAHFLEGEYALAHSSYEVAEGYYLELSDTVNLARTYYDFAELSMKVGNQQAAKKYLDKGLALQAAVSDEIGIQLTYKLLSLWYKEQKNYEQAYLYLIKSNTLKDSILSRETRFRISELDYLYQTEQKERLILTQQMAIEENQRMAQLQAQDLENEKLRNRQTVFIAFFVLIALLVLFLLYRYRNKQLLLLRAQREAALQQALLRTQMNPHFIFNAMSVIQGYIFENDVNSSSKFLVNFSKLMRLILENTSKDWIPLAVELEIIERYLQIQQLRFEGRFRYEIKPLHQQKINQELKTLPMLLQPFIENAIEHGQLDKREDGMVIVTYEVTQTAICFEVKDNGIGYKNTTKIKDVNHKSMATEITRKRLELINQKYQAEASFSITSDDETKYSGTTVKIIVPILKRYEFES